MKDYTLFLGTKYADKDFILGYEIKNDTIIINLSDMKKDNSF